jgi:uncharacterized protein (TIGR02453 family)
MMEASAVLVVEDHLTRLHPVASQSMTSPFTRKTLTFLRALERHNDREWFKTRKDDYERHVRGPMIVLLESLAKDLRTFAPDLVSDPKVSLFRIYRDTRFSGDKSPLKTNIAAHFPKRGFPRGQGAGLYFEIAPRWVWMGGGMYMPGAQDLQAIRARIAETHPRLHRIATAAPFRRYFGELGGEILTRVPRGYAADHVAAGYLRYKQFLAGRERDAELATSPRFYRELLDAFRAAAPLVKFLNEALVERVRVNDFYAKSQRRADL